MTAWFCTCIIAGMLTCTGILCYTIVSIAEFIVKRVEKRYRWKGK